MANCQKCGIPLDEETKCSCEETTCSTCCSCEEKCDCGCKKEK
ncbi:MAG: hypothetical protein WC752_03030 [Patescibacteria group bacterium]